MRRFPQDVQTGTAPTAPVESFVEAMLADLRAFSPLLLDPGLSPIRPGMHRSRSLGTLSLLVYQVETLCGLVPRVLAELAEGTHSRIEELRAVSSPRRAVASRDPRDYAWSPAGLVPFRFLTRVPVPEIDRGTLGWLLHVAEEFRDRLDAATGQVSKHLAHKLASRRDSTWSLRQENDTLRELEQTLLLARARIDRVLQRLTAHANRRCAPSGQPPRPFPSTPAFTSLRRLLDELRHPEDSLPWLLRELLRPGPGAVELPFLYQRWCGVQIVQMLREMGWETQGDPVPALFLGGCIRFCKDRGSEDAAAPRFQISLWCEPHLTLPGRHASGLHSIAKEASPDFVFVTPGPNGVDAFVLDPTMSIERAAMHEKSRYLSDLAFDGLHMVAGVPVLHQPRRAWAAAPIRSSRCELHDLEGRSGTVPVHPLEDSGRALRGWLGDVEAHARAWCRR